MRELFRSRILVFVLIAGVLFSSIFSTCSPPLEGISQPARPWATALRALDPADALTPAHDLTAIYLGEQNDTFQIRIDLLYFRNPKDLSLDIRIEDVSAPEANPLDIHIPIEDNTARITLDPLLATVIIEIPFSEIPTYPRVDVSTPEDQITGLTLDGPASTQSAPLLLTFYDTFAGRFPAEALRSWDGAHTGPRGERHGLKHLLDAAEEYQVPIVLLDLKEPENLSALDAMGVLPQIKSLENQGLFILPENEAFLEAASSPLESADRAQNSGKDFGIPVSPLSYNASTTGFQFAFLEDTNHLYRPLFSNSTYLPIATETSVNQPTPDGPSLEARRALLETALNNDEKDILVLGGNLQNTTWGSPDMVGKTLAYFASRPYIKILTEDDLTGFPTKLDTPDILPYPSDEGFENLKTHYQNLTRPVLEFAENWDGTPISNCDSDIDNDENLECVFSNENYLAILDPQGARLTYLFTVRRNGIPPYVQLIGPSWQVAVGLSDSSTWDLSAGEAADPGAYPGAFADVDDPFKLYEPAIDGNSIIFTSLDGSRTKTFRLTESGIEVEYQTQEPVTTQISLLVDPETRFMPGWAGKYVQENTSGGVAWGLEDGPMVKIEYVALRQAQGDITLSAFNDSLSLLSTPEDPDFDYPPGHYIPFPMAIAEINIEEANPIIQIH
jgi:hypothetical protein